MIWIKEVWCKWNILKIKFNCFKKKIERDWILDLYWTESPNSFWSDAFGECDSEPSSLKLSGKEECHFWPYSQDTKPKMKKYDFYFLKKGGK